MLKIPEWEEGKSYERRSLVSYGGVVYECVRATKGQKYVTSSDRFFWLPVPARAANLLADTLEALKELMEAHRIYPNVAYTLDDRQKRIDDAEFKAEGLLHEFGMIGEDTADAH